MSKLQSRLMARMAVYFGLSQVCLVSCVRAAFFWPDATKMLGGAYLVFVGVLCADSIIEALFVDPQSMMLSRADVARLLKRWVLGIALWGLIALTTVWFLEGPVPFAIAVALAGFLVKPDASLWWPLEGR